MKTHVSFKRDSATLNADAPPFGEDIADSLVASLASQGLGDCSLDSLDYAFTLFCPADTRRCYVMVGLVGDDPQQWLISCAPIRGFVDWPLRRNYDTEVNNVVTSIHQFLTDDPAVSEIRWYTKDGWNADPDEWTPSP